MAQLLKKSFIEEEQNLIREYTKLEETFSLM
jgi:hypothetical protein